MTDPEIISRLDRIEKLLSLLIPAEQPVEAEAKQVLKQGGDLAAYYKTKYKERRRKK